MSCRKKLYFVDGGALLNQPNWNPQCTYNQLLEQYLQYVTSTYSNIGSKMAAVFMVMMTYIRMRMRIY